MGLVESSAPYHQACVLVWIKLTSYLGAFELKDNCKSI